MSAEEFPEGSTKNTLASGVLSVMYTPTLSLFDQKVLLKALGILFSTIASHIHIVTYLYFHIMFLIMVYGHLIEESIRKISAL